MKKVFAVLLGLLLASVATPTHAADSYFKTFSFSANGTVTYTLVGDLQSCTVEVAGGSTMGGGLITLMTAANSVFQAVSGFPDAGSAANPSQTISSGGSALTVPVGSKGALQIVLTGATSPNITGSVRCSNAALQLSALSTVTVPSGQQVPAANPGAGVEVQRLLLGTSMNYLDTLPDNFGFSSLSGAQTTAVYSWSAGSSAPLVNGYVDLLAAQTNGTAAGTVKFVTGYQTSTACDTGVVTLPPGQITFSTTGNTWVVAIGNSGIPLGTASNAVPAPWPHPYPIPGVSGKTMQVCAVLTGASVSATIFWDAGNHAN